MKKLTTLLLSWLLLLGMGAAFAQEGEGDNPAPSITLPIPEFKPADGSAVPPGTTVNITVPDALKDAATYQFVVVIYIENNDEEELLPDAATLNAAAREDMGISFSDDEEEPEPRFWKTASYDQEMGMWWGSVKVSATEGTTKLRMRLAAITYEDRSTVQFSPEFTATYTIDPDAVADNGIAAPTFTLEDGKLYLTNAYTVNQEELMASLEAKVANGEMTEAEAGAEYAKLMQQAEIPHPILYVVNGTDAAFKGIANVDELNAAKTERGLVEYENPIAYEPGMIIKAVTVEISMGGQPFPVALSRVATYPEPLAAPEFKPNGGAVLAGTKVILTNGTESGNTPLPIYYNTSDAAVFTPGTQTELESALAAGQFQAYPSEGIEITEEKTIHAATAKMEAGYVFWSEVISKDFTITTITVAQPVIKPDNSAGKIKLNEKVTITCATDGALIHYTLDGSAPSAESTLYEGPFLLPDGTEVGTEISIRAIAILEGVLSDPIRSNLLVEESGELPEPAPVLPETVKAPVFEPAEGEVEQGTAISWTWDEAYDYEIMGVIYVANGKDEDLNLDATGIAELISAEAYKDEDLVREDGMVYMYYEGEGAYEIAKSATLKARLVLGIIKEELDGDDDPGIEIALSPIVEAAYTVQVEEVATPVFSRAAGEVEKGTEVSIACETKGATIYYTLTFLPEKLTEATEYEEAIVINEDVTITAWAVKGEAKSEEATATYTVKAANENEELAGVTVYPNPSNGVFHITLPIAASIEVFMSNGMLYRHINANAGEFTLDINRSGIYFLRITGEGRTAIKRIIVR